MNKKVRILDNGIAHLYVILTKAYQGSSEKVTIKMFSEKNNVNLIFY